MADASNIKVAIESAMHKEIADMMQTISDQHQICVNTVDVEWNKFVDCNRVLRLRINSETENHG